MDHLPVSGIARAKSEQLEMPTAMSLIRTASAEAITTPEMNGSSSSSRLSQSRKKMLGNSPVRKSSNHQIRKSKSGQLKLDLEDFSSGAALSRASSASLGFSFSFTGFTAPPGQWL